MQIILSEAGIISVVAGVLGFFTGLGFRSKHIMQIILSEAGIISVVAGVLGFFTGLGTAQAVLPFFTSSYHVSLPIDPLLAGLALAMAITLGLGASYYPARWAANLDPHEALRAL